MEAFKNIRLIFTVIALAIVGAILWNTNHFFVKFKAMERTKMEIWATAQSQFLSASSDSEQGPLILKIFQSNQDTPMILVNKNKSYWVNNMPENILEDSLLLASKIDDFSKENTPIEIRDGNTLLATLYYGDADILNKLRYYPLGLLLILFLFSSIVYFYLKSTKVSEQNRLWAGMAKETAHQIATPLSAIIGWTNLLKTREIAPDITTEIEKDIDRLTTITERFSKIGAAPNLEPLPLYKSTRDGVEYLRGRLPKAVNIQMESLKEESEVLLNKPLYLWCLENLIKNAVDAMQGEGNITISFKKDPIWNRIYIQDGGGGIPTSQIKTVFKPGYSTKKRGWGLGLSLAKRIVEEYHQGKISVTKSDKKGTTFEIKLKVQP